MHILSFGSLDFDGEKREIFGKILSFYVPADSEKSSFFGFFLFRFPIERRFLGDFIENPKFDFFAFFRDF